MLMTNFTIESHYFQVYVQNIIFRPDKYSAVINNHLLYQHSIHTVGGIAEWSERWSRPANFPFTAPDC